MPRKARLGSAQEYTPSDDVIKKQAVGLYHRCRYYVILTGPHRAVERLEVEI
jgi:hypothetical protein